MGIPGLFPFLLNNHAFNKAFNRFSKDSKKSYKLDYVYLDANGLLHSAAQQVYNYGENKQLQSPYENLTPIEKRLRVFELFFENIETIISIVIPKKLLYIAIDGPAPRAKQAQQRQRRFISAKASTIKLNDDNTPKSDFSSVEITPGTEFMHELSKFMYWKIRDFLSKQTELSPVWKNIDIIYSPPTVPGEGEHKIMDYIRSLSQYERDTATHCMFGPDGDLLILMLSAHVKKMYLFREDINNKYMVDLIDARFIKFGLVNELNFYSMVKNKQRTEDDISNDFTIIASFIGNDFLSILKLFFNLKDGLDKMFNIYNKLKTEHGWENAMITKNGKLQLKGLRYFIKALSDVEESYIANQATLNYKVDEKFVDHTLLKHSTVIIDNNILGTQHISKINMPEYRISYYNKAGIDRKSSVFDPYNENFEKHVKQMCKDYLRNLGWVYIYYTEKLPSWDEAYEWHYSPLMCDLLNYINSITQEQLNELLTFNKGNPSLPFEQLLSVLPPTLSSLLPNHYRGLMSDKDSKLVKAGYYPLTFNIDYEGKFKEHQGIAILPFIQFKIVSDAYKLKAESDEYKYHRNEFSLSSLFKWDDGVLIDFESEYGVVRDCKLKCIKI